MASSLFARWLQRDPEKMGKAKTLKVKEPLGKDKIIKEVRSISVIVIMVFAFRSVFLRALSHPLGFHDSHPDDRRFYFGQ